MRMIAKYAVLLSVLVSSACAVKVNAIKYVGCERIDKETIENYFPIKVGDDCDTETINDAVRTLQETELFTDVNVTMKGNTVVVDVKEAPIINKISFEGNSKISDKDMKKALNIGSRETLSTSKVKQIQQALLEQYRQMGRYNATVNPKIIRLKDNRVNLVFEINEGKAAGISRIVFIGNEQISSSELKDVIRSKVKKWFRFFVSDDIYNADRLEEDKQLVEQYYHEHGYINAKVLSAVAELSSNKKSFVITFRIEEGELYTFGKLSLKSNVEKIATEGLNKTQYCRTGDVYRESFVNADASQITRELGQRGYPTVQVSPKIKKDYKRKTVDVEFNINEGEKVYISKIVITGNTKTRDNVIRREIILDEGDAYNRMLVKMSESNIYGLGFFSNVNIKAIPDPNAPDKCILHVEVKEQPTAEASVNAAYETTSGFGVDLQYQEQNFMGTGKALSVYLGSSRTVSGKSSITDESGSTSREKKKAKFRIFNNVNISVSDPHVFDKDMEGSVSMHRNVSSIFDGFNSNELGAGLGLSYELSPNWSQSWGFKLDRRKFQDVSTTASPIILSQVQEHSGNTLSKDSATNMLSEVTHTITYAKRFIRGLKGNMNVSLETSIAGFCGDARHLKNVISGAYVMPVFRKTALRFELSTGMINKFCGRDPHILDSFIMGGDSFRGFEYAGVGPIASTLRVAKKTPGKTTYNSRRDFIGAKKFWKGTLEYTFPLGLPEELEFRGFVFTDFGALWDAPNKKNKFITEKDGSTKDANGLEHKNIGFKMDDKVAGQKIFDKCTFKQSVGLGISLVSPFGPIEIAYAKPVKKGKYDEQQRFIFKMGRSF